MVATPCWELKECKNLIDKYDCIGIDEGQFVIYSFCLNNQFPDLVEFCETAANKGRVVVVSALNGTFERKPFGQIPNLIPHCENITNLTAICASCQKEASFSKRISKEQKKEKLNSDIDIGGSDKYEASCRNCFNK